MEDSEKYFSISTNGSDSTEKTEMPMERDDLTILANEDELETSQSAVDLIPPIEDRPKWSDVLKGHPAASTPQLSHVEQEIPQAVGGGTGNEHFTISTPEAAVSQEERPTSDIRGIGQRSKSDSNVVDGERRIRRYSISLQDNTVTELTSADESEESNIEPIMECLCETGVCLAHPSEGKVQSAEETYGTSGRKTVKRKVSRQISFPGASGSMTDVPTLRRNDVEVRLVDTHCHSNLSISAADVKARRKLMIASALCLLFMIGEAVGGYLANSLAIATDAAHLLTDFASFMISLFSLWMATRPATKHMSFGYYRAEVLGALTSVLMIWVVTGVLVYIAAERIISKEFEIDATVMLITSAVGVAVNILMGLTLHQHGHSHSQTADGPDDTSPLLGSHSHSEHKKQANINVRAAFIHVVGDLLQSVGVFIAALVIYFQPTWVLVDPICTFLFSFLVLLTTISVMRDTMQVLMEGMPRGIDFNEVLKLFNQIKGVQQVHNLRIWALSLDKCALSAHLAVDPDASSQEILSEATRLIRSRYDFFEMALQIEHFMPHMDNCKQCRSPPA